MMPSKKKKYNARFPPARIKKIMQKDEEVGKVAAAVPVIISRALELFIESLILKTNETTSEKNAKTLTTSHIKHTIVTERQFDFLNDLVASIPDHQIEDDMDDGNHTNNKKHKVPRQRKNKEGAKPGRRKKRKESSEESSNDNGDNEDDDEDDCDETETGEEDDSDELKKNCSASSPLDLTCGSSPSTSYIMGSSPPFPAQTRPLLYPNNSAHPFMQPMMGMPPYPMPPPAFTGFPRMAAPPIAEDDDYDT